MSIHRKTTPRPGETEAGRATARAWAKVHRRHDVTYAVAEDVAQSGRDALAHWRLAIDTEFGGLGGLLQDVQRRWYAAFDARLDAVLATGHADRDAVADLWATVGETLPTLRSVLDTFADDPALDRIRAHHRELLFATTGIDESALRPTLATV